MNILERYQLHIGQRVGNGHGGVFHIVAHTDNRIIDLPNFYRDMGPSVQVQSGKHFF